MIKLYQNQQKHKNAIVILRTVEIFRVFYLAYCREIHIKQKRAAKATLN